MVAEIELMISVSICMAKVAAPSEEIAAVAYVHS